MLRMHDGSAAFAGDKVPSQNRRQAGHGGLGPAIGLTLAGASSLILWDVLVQVARWAAHLF